MAQQPVRVLDEQMFDPPRRVEVDSHGGWHVGYQRAWRLCDDVRGWMAEVRWSEQHDWSLGTYDTMVAPERVRLPASGHIHPDANTPTRRPSRSVTSSG